MVDGGSHLSGFRSASTRTINYAATQAGLIKDAKENLTGDDVRGRTYGSSQREASAAAVLKGQTKAS